MKAIRILLQDIRGATAVEYGFLAALISGLMLGGLGIYSDKLSTMLTYITTTIEDAHKNAPPPPS